MYRNVLALVCAPYTQQRERVACYTFGDAMLVPARPAGWMAGWNRERGILVGHPMNRTNLRHSFDIFYVFANSEFLYDFLAGTRSDEGNRRNLQWVVADHSIIHHRILLHEMIIIIVRTSKKKSLFYAYFALDVRCEPARPAHLRVS